MASPSAKERFVLLGYSFQAHCLIVNHCYWEFEAVIRLISQARDRPRRGNSLETSIESKNEANIFRGGIF
jgi:uncharacterized DUF497 family protein